MIVLMTSVHLQSSVSPATASPSGAFSQKRTSFLPSQRVVLRSAASISGRANGFNVFCAPKVANSSAVGRTGIRCEAAVAEKEAPVEKFEYQAEVHFFTVLLSCNFTSSGNNTLIDSV